MKKKQIVGKRWRKMKRQGAREREREEYCGREIGIVDEGGREKERGCECQMNIICGPHKIYYDNHSMPSQ